MRRSPMPRGQKPLQRKAPMNRGTAQLARSGFKRKAPDEKQAAQDIKKKRRAPRPGRSKKALEACRGQPCYLLVPHICLGEPGQETVVPCHPNWADYGKGMGLKADDKYVVPGCFACHSWLDQGSAPGALKRAVFESALERWTQAKAA